MYPALDLNRCPHASDTADREDTTHVDTAVERANVSGAVFVRFRIRENDPLIVDSIEIRGVADSAIRTRIRRA